MVAGRFGNPAKWFRAVLGAILLLNMWRRLLALFRVKPKVLPSDEDTDYIIVFNGTKDGLHRMNNNLPEIVDSTVLGSSETSPNHMSERVKQWLMKGLRGVGLDVIEGDGSFWEEGEPAEPNQSKQATQFTVWKVAAPWITLCREAERQGMLKETAVAQRQESNALTFPKKLPFTVAGAQEGVFEGFEQDRCYFTMTERQILVDGLLSSIKGLGHRSVIPVLASKDLISCYPLHDHNIKGQVQEKIMAKPEADESLDLLASYFGTEVGFYAAFVAFYVQWLVPASVAGVIFWFLQDGESVNWFMIAYSGMMSLWATVFLEFWKRRSATLAFRWDVLRGSHQDNDDSDILAEPRPEFGGDLAVSPVTGQLEVTYSLEKRRKKYLVSAPICALFVALCWALMTLSFWLEDLTKEWQARHMFTFSLINDNIHHLPVLLYSVTIPILNPIYREVAYKLTEWENHRTQQSHNNAIIVKLVPFYFVNCFISLFYLAFVKMDIPRLRSYMACLLVSTQIFGGVMEVMMPYIVENMKVRKRALARGSKGKANGKANGQQPNGSAAHNGSQTKSGPRRRSRRQAHPVERKSAKPASPPISSPVTEEDQHGVQVEAYEMEGQLSVYPGVFDEYIEVVMQFGYVTLFGWCWPLAALCACVNNVVEVRSDILKLCTSYRKPRIGASQPSSIGDWYGVLELMSLSSVVTNFAFLGLWILHFQGRLVTVDPSEQLCFDPPSEVELCAAPWAKSTAQTWREDLEAVPSVDRIWLLVVVEHLLIALKWWLAKCIPDQSEEVNIGLARQRWQHQQLLRHISSTGSTNSLGSLSDPPRAFFQTPTKAKPVNIDRVARSAPPRRTLSRISNMSDQSDEEMSATLFARLKKDRAVMIDEATGEMEI